MESKLSFYDCTLNVENHTIENTQQSIHLRKKLWRLLLLLARQPNQPVMRNILIENIWQGNRYTGEQGLTHAVCHLRIILKKLDLPVKITTLPKVGYILQNTDAHLG